jgi:hypothetical protein
LTLPSVGGKLEKMGVLCTHSPKSPSPFPKLPIKNFKKIQKIQKKGTRLTLRKVGLVPFF